MSKGKAEGTDKSLNIAYLWCKSFYRSDRLINVLVCLDVVLRRTKAHDMGITTRRRPVPDGVYKLVVGMRDAAP